MNDNRTGYHGSEAQFNLESCKKMNFKENYEKSLLKQKQGIEKEDKNGNLKTAVY